MSARPEAKIAVLGAGSWGTALAVLLAGAGRQVVLWDRNEDRVAEIANARTNTPYLPDVEIPAGVHPTADLEEAVDGRDMLVLAVPSQFLREVVRRLSFSNQREIPIFVSTAKGIENRTLLRMSQVLTETIPELLPERIVVLSGPSHAEEVARKIPTAVVAASVSADTARAVQQAFMTPSFRVYTHTDVVGVELGGALKNVIALAAGIGDGVGYGDNTKAALMTRGMVEITRLGVALGADRLTFAGLSGMGDLIVTCMSRHSRNRYVGEQIGKGRNLQEVLDEMVI
jgi:glycerol-3-phosphate dehydrogenase (NAD(P)+)